jgi:fucose permease
MKRHHLPLIISFVCFVCLGLPDSVLGVAWPSIRQDYLLPQSGLGMILISVGLGFLTMSFNMGSLVQRWGMGRLLALGTFLVATGLTGYVLSSSWPAFLACAYVAGLGAGSLHSGLNAYVAEKFSGRLVNWLHACYGLGATIGPLLMTAAIQQTGNWRWGYLFVVGCMLTMSLTFTLTRRLWVLSGVHSPVLLPQPPIPTAQPVPAAPQPPANMRAALQNPLVRLQIIIFFLYTGVEVTAGQWSFTLLTEARGVDATQAGIWVSTYWAFLMIGRITFGALIGWLPMTLLVRLSLVGVMMGAGLLALRGGATASVLGLSLLGFALAPVFPSLMKQTPERVGKRLAAYAVGFQSSAATLGIMVVPSFTGLLVQWISLEMVGSVLLVVALLLFLLHERLVGKTAV